MNRRSRTIAALFFALLVFVAAGLLFPATSAAQQPQAPSNTPPPSSSRPPNSGQVRGYTLPPSQEAQAVAYAHARHELYFIDVAYGLLLLVLILNLRIAPKYRDWAANWTDSSFGQIVVFTPLLMLTADVLSLPTAIWAHRLALQYHQSIQDWGSWLADWLKGEGVQIALGILIAWLLFTVIRKSPRRWWLYFWLAAVPLIILGAVAEPLIIEPLFFKFAPLANAEPQLAKRIEQMTIRAGVPIPQSRIFEMAASAKLNELNAYVTGLSASKRVVIWDTTIQKTSNDESLFIVGHELGHYVLGHVRQGFLLGAAGLLLSLYFLFRGLHWAMDRWAKDWKLYGQEDWASLVVLLLLLQVLTFVSSPVISGYRRMQEHAADVYGLEVIHGLVPDSEEVAAHAFQVLGEMDLSDPNPPPFITFWLYSHPPLAERLVFAHGYDPWSKGKSPKYVKLPFMKRVAH